MRYSQVFSKIQLIYCYYVYL